MRTTPYTNDDALYKNEPIYITTHLDGTSSVSQGEHYQSQDHTPVRYKLGRFEGKLYSFFNPQPSKEET